MVVLDRSPTPVATDAEWRSVLEIDPTNQAWSTRLPDWTQIRRLPGIPKRPIGSVRTTAVTTELGVFVELPSTPANTEPHWQAYPLTLERPNPGLNEVLVFSPYLIHGGAFNQQTDATRVSLEMRFWRVR